MTINFNRRGSMNKRIARVINTIGFLLLFGAAIGLVSLAVEAAAKSEEQKLYEQVRLSTAAIYTSYGSGSGFYVAPHYLITNEHVIEGSTVVDVVLQDQARPNTINKLVTAGEVIYYDADIDLAVVFTPGHVGIPVPIGNASRVDVGDRVISVGSPYGFFNTLSQGTVTGKFRSIPLHDVSYLQVDMDIAPGSSGSAIFNLAGEVVGVSNMLVGALNGVELALDADLIFHGPMQEIEAHMNLIAREING